MADPLGLIGGAGGVRPGSPLRANPNAASGEQGQGPSFKDVLLDNINKVNELQQEATTATEDLVTGKRGDLEGVLLATAKADNAFRMLLALRNKVQAAYDEVKQVRI